MGSEAGEGRHGEVPYWNPAGDERGFVRLATCLREPSDDALLKEAEEWNRQIEALDERRNSYERLLRGIVQRKERSR